MQNCSEADISEFTEKLWQIAITATHALDDVELVVGDSHVESCALCNIGDAHYTSWKENRKRQASITSTSSPLTPVRAGELIYKILLL